MPILSVPPAAGLAAALAAAEAAGLTLALAAADAAGLAEATALAGAAALAAAGFEAGELAGAAPPPHDVRAITKPIENTARLMTSILPHALIAHGGHRHRRL